MSSTKPIDLDTFKFEENLYGEQVKLEKPDPMYDPNISILLEPNLDWTFDRFLGSIFQEDDVFVWQIYRNGLKNQRPHYNTTTWDLAKARKTARVADSKPLQIALQWHCRHALVRNWCTDEIRKKAGFDELDSDDGIAMMYYFDT